MFRLLLPISPLSTGLITYFSLPRLGGEVHLTKVIGTEVPASNRKAGNGKKEKRRVTEGPISADRQCEALRRFAGPVGKRRRKS